jgi:hypothetical protein
VYKLIEEFQNNEVIDDIFLDELVGSIIKVAFKRRNFVFQATYVE